MANRAFLLKAIRFVFAVGPFVLLMLLCRARISLPAPPFIGSPAKYQEQIEDGVETNGVVSVFCAASSPLLSVHLFSDLQTPASMRASLINVLDGTPNPIMQSAFPTHSFINDPVGDDFRLVRRLKLNLAQHSGCHAAAAVNRMSRQSDTNATPRLIITQ